MHFTKRTDTRELPGRVVRDILKLLLPTIIVESFELTSYQTPSEVMHLYLQEINQIPKEFDGQKLESKRMPLLLNNFH